ncbi:MULTISPECIES: site-2 protease family protein [Actinopolyspora]|uniref:Zinc metalloprotease n=1 Tax=Actinopolyspora saharensis TaxID=995062 RepID=A0A1H0YCU6_9ACTN|nr:MULTISPECIES: site-2 protease family protein [Actinopolyspora]NHD17682.1 site-2 protease family protein [Actinopolyspora sp. BKK2]NHE76585.1 site-2 protease family protein [Actinopolyspora sp. BKK1]SDQ13024.1 Zn-dependent protease (includes SpoIVFB) [Actinopolyspora saharensis]
MATTAGGERTGTGTAGLQLCRVSGVPVLLSPSWWLGAAVIVLLYTPLVGRLLPGSGVWASALVATAFTVFLAGSVLLHELGHCLVALRLGLPVRRVRLFLLGGISEIARTPPTPFREGLIAAAGPAVSLVLAACTGVGWFALQPHGAVWLLVVQTCVANLAVGVFNLLPGLPLDGGRMVRAATWKLTEDRHRGTIAAVVGAGAVAVGLLCWALVGVVTEAQGRWLRLAVCVLMAWFVIAGAVSEYSAGRRERWPRGMELRDLLRPVLQLPAESPVGDALLAAAGRGVVLVRADGVAVGLLDEDKAVRLVDTSPREPAERAAEEIRPETVLLDSESPEAVLHRVGSVSAGQFLVVDQDGKPCGVLRRSELRAAARRRGTNP